MTRPVPCSSAEAIQRAVKYVGGPALYGLGKGGYYPDRPDDPFTHEDGVMKCDCSRYAICYCFKLRGHRPGFNKSSKATVTDDINCDSAIEQAEDPNATDRVFEIVTTPALGDLLVYPSIRGPDHKRLRIGHVGIVVKLCAEWDPETPQYGELEVVQCQASRKPAVMRGPGVGWLFRDKFRGTVNEAWRTRILRVVT